MERNQVLGNSPVETVDYGEGKDLPCEFERRFVEDAFQTEKQGRTIGEEKFFCTIYHLGGDSVCHEVNPDNPSDPRIRRFRKQWEAFVANQEQIPDGLLLDMWPRINKSKKEELNRLRIYTVEQLAEAPDSVLQDISMDGMTLAQDAKKWLEQYHGTEAKVEQLTQEKNETERRLKEMERKFEEMELKAIASKPKKKAGRPPKKKETVDEPTHDSTEHSE